MVDKRVPHLPPGLLPRGLTKAQAATCCGCETLTAFDEWVRQGIVPKAMPGTTRWDRRAIDRALDRRYGLIAEAGGPDESFEEWAAQHQ